MCEAGFIRAVLRVQLLNPFPQLPSSSLLSLCPLPVPAFIDHPWRKRPFTMDNAHLARAPASSSRATLLLDQIHNEFQNQFRAAAEAEYKCASSFFPPWTLPHVSPSRFPHSLLRAPTQPLHPVEQRCFSQGSYFFKYCFPS